MRNVYQYIYSGGIAIIPQLKLFRGTNTRRNKPPARQQCRDPCENYARETPQPVESNDRFSHESLRKEKTFDSIKNCRRIRLSDPKYKEWGFGKIIIAVPNQVLIWFPDVNSHLCFTKDAN